MTFSTVGGTSTSTSWSNRQPLALADERSLVDERSHQLLEEERVPLGGFEDPPFHVGRERPGADERVRAAPVPRLPRAPRALSRACGAGARGRRSPSPATTGDRVRAVSRARAGARTLSVSLQQAFEQLERGRVRPVQVLERRRRPDRPAARRASSVADHLERPVLERFGRELGHPLASLGLQRETEHRTKVRVDLEHPRRRTARRGCGAAPRGRGARARPRGRRATSAAGRGRASTASTRRRRRTAPRATSVARWSAGARSNAVP